MVRLSIPAQLVFRDLALSAVLTALDAGGEGPGSEARDEIISALAEAFNNVVLHAYRGVLGGRLDLAVSLLPGELEIHVLDRGRGFDPASVRAIARVGDGEPSDVEIAALPENGMGLFIIHSFMDEVAYTPGRPGEPNVLVMRKRWRVPAGSSAPELATPSEMSVPPSVDLRAPITMRPPAALPVAAPGRPGEPRKETSQSGWRMRSVAVPPAASAARTAGSLKRK